MGHRGRERTVRCEKCGREVRRDKALFIEKNIFTNPLERKDVHSETYNRVLTREVSYCISCGKHARLFEKKKQQQERTRERERFSQFNRPGQYRQGGGTGGGQHSYSRPREQSASQSQEQQAQPSQTSQPPQSSSESSAQTGEGQA